MTDEMITQTLVLAKYLLLTQGTVRQTASVFDMAKSTVHSYLQHNLPQIDSKLHVAVQQVLDNNWLDKHNRGGEATKRKWNDMGNQERGCSNG